MHNIHKGEKSDVDIRQGDAVSGETNGDHCREGEERIGGDVELGHQVKRV